MSNQKMPDNIDELKLLLEAGNKKAYLHIAFCYESQFDYENANLYYKLGAESGEPDAQFFYAYRLENGVNVEVDIIEANKYYKLSADNGNTDAAFRLSMNLAEGNGCNQNDSESRRYLELAKKKRKPPGPTLNPDDINQLIKYADEGNDEAMLLCGFFYEKKGDENEKALQFFRQSADNGNPNAQFIISLRLENGIDCEKDLESAAKYLQLAIDGGNLDAQSYMMHKQSKNNNPSAGFDKLPNDFNSLKKLAEKGNTFAQLRVGLILDNEHKSDEANRFIKQSADNGNPNAQFIFGLRNEFGITMTIDIAEANNYYRKSAILGNEDAQYRLGINLLNGNGIIKNAEEANIFLKMSADLGNKDACIAYGANLKEGIGCEANPEQGDVYIKKSMSQ